MQHKHLLGSTISALSDPALLACELDVDADADKGAVPQGLQRGHGARGARERASKSSESIGDSLHDAWIHTKIRSKLLGEGAFPEGAA